VRRNVEYVSRWPKHRRCLTIKTTIGEITHCHSVHRCNPRVGYVCLGPVDASRGNDAFEFLWRRSLMPFANSGKHVKRIFRAGVKILRRVEDQLAADETAGVVA